MEADAQSWWLGMDINYVGSGSWRLVTVAVMMLVNATECTGKKILSTNHDFYTSLFTPVAFMRGMTHLWYGGGWTLGGTAISHLLIT